MAARRARLGDMTYPQFVGMAHDGGFFMHAPRGSILAIPGGMLVFMASAEPNTCMSYLRWNVLPKADIPCVNAALDEMLRSYHFLQTTDYNSIAKLCSAALEEGSRGDQ